MCEIEVISAKRYLLNSALALVSQLTGMQSLFFLCLWSFLPVLRGKVSHRITNGQRVPPNCYTCFDAQLQLLQCLATRVRFVNFYQFRLKQSCEGLHVVLFRLAVRRCVRKMRAHIFARLKVNSDVLNIFVMSKRYSVSLGPNTDENIEPPPKLDEKSCKNNFLRLKLKLCNDATEGDRRRDWQSNKVALLNALACAGRGIDR